MTCGIYSITNKINGKIYIGQSVNIRKRWNIHKSLLNRDIHPNEHLQSSWNKYGADNFDFKLIKCCKSRYLDRFEKLQIKIHDSVDSSKGYNLDSGGSVGYIITDEVRKKMSKAQSGKNHPLYGKHHSEETKQKMSESRMGEKNGFYGKHHSHESRKKISDTKRRKDIPLGDVLLSKNQQGITYEAMAKEYNCSIATIHNRIENYKKEGDFS